MIPGFIEKLVKKIVFPIDEYVYTETVYKHLNVMIKRNFK